MKRQRYWPARLWDRWVIVGVLMAVLLFGPGSANGLSVAGELGSRDAGAQSSGITLRSSTAVRTITYTYDNAGRLVHADYGAGWAIDYTYDPGGNLLTRQTAGGVLSHFPLMLQ